MQALFVTFEGALKAPLGGGVQICSEEFRQALIAAGYDCRVWPVPLRYSLAGRVRHRLLPHLYSFSDFTSQAESLVREVERTGVRHVFLNMVDLAPLARWLRRRVGDRCTIVLLSHGLGSADFLHQIRMAHAEGRTDLPQMADALRLGIQLLQEVDQRRYLDHVFCLSETERQLELWLGAKRATWLPRVGYPNPLDWQPVTGRVGFVGTLDHPPNAEGLRLYLQAVAEQGAGSIEVRVVGGPERRGRELEATYPFVRYLGQLDEPNLAAEASTWTCMVHPLFCYARGCSTKLAVGLGWGIPILTTRAGHRGYRWRDGSLGVADSPSGLVRLTRDMADPQRRDRLRGDVQRVAETLPTIAEVALLVREAIGPHPDV